MTFFLLSRMLSWFFRQTQIWSWEGKFLNNCSTTYDFWALQQWRISMYRIYSNAVVIEWQTFDGNPQSFCHYIFIWSCRSWRDSWMTLNFPTTLWRLVLLTIAESDRPFEKNIHRFFHKTGHLPPRIDIRFTLRVAWNFWIQRSFLYFLVLFVR